MRFHKSTYQYKQHIKKIEYENRLKAQKILAKHNYDILVKDVEYNEILKYLVSFIKINQDVLINSLVCKNNVFKIRNGELTFIENKVSINRIYGNFLIYANIYYNKSTEEIKLLKASDILRKEKLKILK